MNFNKLTLILGFTGLIISISFQFYKLNKLELESIPSSISTASEINLEFTKMNGQLFTDQHFPKNQSYMLMYMDPTCADCEKMIEKMFKYYSEFEHIHIIMVTESDISQVIKFRDEYHIDRYNNIEVVLDPNQVMYKHFGLVERDWSFSNLP